jgi:hypothetical protein
MEYKLQNGQTTTQIQSRTNRGGQKPISKLDFSEVVFSDNSKNFFSYRTHYFCLVVK